MQFSTAISSVFLPKVTTMVTIDNDDKNLSDLFIKTGRLQYLVLCFILCGFIVFGRYFIRLWAGTEYSDAYIITLLFFSSLLIPLIQNLGIEIQRAKNMHKARSVVYFCIPIINIFISIPLIKLLGPSGAALGTCISLFVGNGLFMNWYYHSRIGLNIIVFWKTVAPVLISATIVTIIGFLGTFLLPVSGLATFFFWGVAYSVLYCAACWLFVLRDSEKNRIKAMFARLGRR